MFAAILQLVSLELRRHEQEAHLPKAKFLGWKQYTYVPYKYIVVQQNLLYKLFWAQEVSLNNLQYGSRM